MDWVARRLGCCSPNSRAAKVGVGNDLQFPVAITSLHHAARGGAGEVTVVWCDGATARCWMLERCDGVMGDWWSGAMV